MQRLHIRRRIDLAHVDQPQPHRFSQRAVLFIARTTDLHRAISQFNDSDSFGTVWLASRQIDLPLPRHGIFPRRGEQRAAINQPAVHHGPGQQMHAGLRQRGPLGADIPLAVRHHGYHRGWPHHLPCPLCRCPPTMRLPILEWAIPMALGHHARSGPDLTAHQSKAGVGGGVHRDPPPSH